MKRYSLWSCYKPVELFSQESIESTEDAECIGDDGTFNELWICLFIIGLLLNERRRSGCDGSKEEIIIWMNLSIKNYLWVFEIN